MPAWLLSHTYIFSRGHSAAFSHLGILDITSPLHMGTILNKHHPKKHKNEYIMALNRLQKGTCLQYESWNEEAEHHPVQPQLETWALSSLLLYRDRYIVEEQINMFVKKNAFFLFSISSEFSRPWACTRTRSGSLIKIPGIPNSWNYLSYLFFKHI